MTPGRLCAERQDELLDLQLMLGRTLGDTVGLEVKCPSGMAAVFADPSQLESALVNLALNFALVPYLGIYGAAIATAASMVSWNMLLSSACKSKLGLRISAF